MISCREWGEEKNSENVANKFALKFVLFCFVSSTKFYTERDGPKSNPFPFYIPFLTEKAALSYTFY